VEGVIVEMMGVAVHCANVGLIIIAGFAEEI